MKIMHNSQQSEYRKPFGALPVGEVCRLRLAVWDEAPEDGDWLCDATLRLWSDGVGERLLPMSVEQGDDPSVRWFAVDVPAEEQAGLLWYYFILRTGTDDLLFWGNNADGLGGEGRIWTDNPRSYQITVYQPENVPDWYTRAICYQIFPDRFARGADWEDCRKRAANDDWQGAEQIWVEDWQTPPHYPRDEEGRVVGWQHFGGTLQGIREHLLYLKSLGVSAIYLNPIFRATSNHKYDTADYRQIDFSFGTEQDFSELAAAAERLGIRLILDGVFSHTGADSRYFNRWGNYPDLGAYQSEESLYYPWYKFNSYPDDYACWWGVASLPEVDKSNADFRRFIYEGEESVVRRWLNLGASGWRLDVADELPEDFIAGVRAAAKATKADALILGEVWEDASNKISYAKQRHYLLGGSLDATMNYPFRTAVLQYLLGERTAADLSAALMSLKENYPPKHFAAAYNLIGSHDTVRAINALSGVAEPQEGAATDSQSENMRLTAEQYQKGAARLKQAALLQFATQGVPAIYYGDEAGVEGFADPYNRAAYPWGAEDKELLHWYRRMAQLRAAYPLLADGEFQPFALNEDVYACRRYWGKDEQCREHEEILLLINRADHNTSVEFSVGEMTWGRDLLSGEEVVIADDKGGTIRRELAPLAAEIWLLREDAPPQAKLARAAGVLCHITSLPPTDGGWQAAARRFIDYLAMAKQKLWQVLPLNPVGEGLSPYTPLSVFAGHEGLAAELLRKTDWRQVPIMEYAAFCRDNAYWLEDYALFAAISEARGGLNWQRWPKRERDREDLPKLFAQYAEEMEQVRRRQFLFWREWSGVKTYAAHRGISLIGDMPIYPALNSADVWANQDLFLLDEEGYAVLTAGVPPDYFAEDGQNWGNPLYNWENMRRDGYRWWRNRCQVGRERFDWLRVDHFRAFAAYWAIPIGGAAKDGYWLPACGVDMFNTIEREIGRLPLLAEDLGYLDTEVANLLRLSGYHGMAVYQFMDNDSALQAADMAERVLYSGTHDNQTLYSWLAAKADIDADLSDEAKDEQIRAEVRQHIEKLYQSKAPWVIIPLQDMLGLDDRARMNTPGVAEGNWQWQADWQDLKLPLAAEFAARVRNAQR